MNKVLPKVVFILVLDKLAIQNVDLHIKDGYVGMSTYVESAENKHIVNTSDISNNQSELLISSSKKTFENRKPPQQFTGETTNLNREIHFNVNNEIRKEPDVASFNLETQETVVKKSNMSIKNPRFVESTNDNTNFINEFKQREDVFQITTPESSPYSVLLFLFTKNGQRIGAPCTGTLLTKEWVLTSAFCLTSTTNKVDHVFVYAGGNNEKEFVKKTLALESQVLKSSKVIPHPNYRRDRFDVSFNDIAVIKTEKKFTLSDKVNIVKLSFKPWSFTSHKECHITGFGKLRKFNTSYKDYERKRYNMQVKSPCKCLKKNYTKLSQWICNWPRENHGVCEGDLGGGLICGDEVRGVASLFVSVRDVASCELFLPTFWECGMKYSFSVFQNVCPHAQWINYHVNLVADSDIPDECRSQSSRELSINLGLLFMSLILYSFVLENYCCRFSRNYYAE